MTINEAADKWRMSRGAVLQWCRKGIIPGAYKGMAGKRVAWLLPDDAVMPPEEDRKGGLVKPDSSDEQKSCPTKEQYIMRAGATQSTRCIADKLGISTAEVRSIYGRIYNQNNP